MFEDLWHREWLQGRDEEDRWYLRLRRAQIGQERGDLWLKVKRCGMFE